jgi:hypothetical protein
VRSEQVTNDSQGMTTRTAIRARSFLLRLALSWAIIFLFALLSRAGGPKSVAGTSYFDPTTTGQPLVWSQGLVTYYTDQGDLSPILPNASANSLVADAFSQWTSVPTAALAAASGGQLAEDVNGTNVTVNSDGTISIPADIQSTATATPIGIVYDYDGSVTDALIGSGAGNSSECFANAVFGGNDNYGVFATYQHALIVINGQCALQSSQLKDVEYRLVRVIGSVLGLGWSQVNPTPLPTSDDYAGFPVMHSTDPLNCTPITICYANPYQLAMDDAASLSRLYPVTAQNQSSFPGRQVFSAVTARIPRFGVVYRHARKSDTGHAGRQRGGALDRFDNRAAVAQVRGGGGLRFSIHRQRGQSHHEFRRRAGKSLCRLGVGQPNSGRLLRLGWTPTAKRQQGAISVKRGSARSEMVFRSRPLLARSSRAFGTDPAHRGDCHDRQ